MAITAATATAITLVSTAIATSASIYGSIQSAKAQQKQLNAQKEQAQYQAEIDRQNKQLAEQEASAQRRAGYENMTAKRLETARQIGRQRAIMGANGATLDEGSNLETIADTAASGELDAINIYNQGVDSSYRKQLEAWNYGQRAAGEEANASAYGSAANAAPGQGYMNAAIAGLSGIASMGSTWANYQAQNPDPVNKTHWDIETPEELVMRHPSGQKWASVKKR